MPTSLNKPEAVTFDCWATLLVERNPGWGPARRAAIFRDHTGAGVDDARAALNAAWREHQRLWHHRVAFTARHMTERAIEALQVSIDDTAKERLVRALEDEALNYEVAALDGAREALEALAAAGVRRALICDTGFSPGRVVRALLARVGLLPLLEVTIFSDEVGVPKPDPRPFAEALGGLSTEAARAVHVGDIRRSDIAGARGVGMGSVRLALHHDDGDSGPSAKAGVIGCDEAGCAPPCARPEADAVARSYPELMSLIGFG